MKIPLRKQLGNKKDLQKWLVTIHNEVNKIHKKRNLLMMIL